MSEPKTTPVAFRFQPATKEALRTIAQREGRSMTGKLDVRDVAASLPDETEGMETLNEALALADGEDMADDFDANPEETEA